MKEHALIYLGASKKHKNAIIKLLEQFNFAYTFLNDSDLHQQVNTLFNKQSEENIINEKFNFNFIFFKDIDHQKILQFYTACDEQGFPFSHKAVMTVHNQQWIMEDLLNEINEEHTFFQLWTKLNTLLKEANECDPSLYSEASFEAYKMAFINAYIYQKQPSPNKDMIGKLIDHMIETRKQLIYK